SSAERSLKPPALSVLLIVANRFRLEDLKIDVFNSTGRPSMEKESRMETKDKTILVTGATGHQGGTVVRHLLKDGWKVRALTRHPEHPQAKELGSIGAQVVQGDLDIPLSLQEPLQGCYGVFSVQQPWEHGPDDEIKQGIALVDAAKGANVKHFVYSSMAGAEKSPGVPHMDSKSRVEEYLRNSGLDYTIFRPVWFMEDLFSRKDSIYNGKLRLPLKFEVPLQVIAVDDIGKFVTMAFENPENWAKKELDIAGDELTGAEMAQILGDFIGRRVSYEEEPLEEVREYSSDAAMMYDWLNLRGFSADIAQVRDFLPELKTFEDWTRESGWTREAA
ncbi:MAG: NmrA/HSCARG family protein, partial [Chitinispirillaceae bacterium]